jgi:hypothetical protein
MEKLYFFILIIAITVNVQSQSIGGKILFSHHNGYVVSNRDTIYTIDSLGTKAFVTLGYRPRLSHNGQYLAFSNGPNSNSSYDADLWIRNLTAQTETQIVSNGDYLDYYDFYPGDNRLVYSQSCSIYTTNVDGSNSYHYIANYPGDCFSDDPTIRVFDSAIAYHNVHYGLFKMNSDGSNPQQVANTVRGDLDPSWSHDGQWLAYYKPIPGSYNGGTGVYVPTNSVYKVNVATGDTVRLSFLSLNDTLAPDPIWSKDDQSLYAIGRINDTMGVYEIKTDGSGYYWRIYTFDSSGTVADYWLGLSDSIKNNILPVSLIKFSGSYTGKDVQLNWQTAEEINSSYFNVQRSLNGIAFSDIGTVSSKGNSTTINDYVFYDVGMSVLDDNANVLYYRLKQVDKDGRFVFSKTIQVNKSENNTAIIYPNPTTGNFKIVLPQVNDQVDVMIYNTSGNKVYHQLFNNASTADIQMNLPKGVYMVKITGNKISTQRKLIIQ